MGNGSKHWVEGPAYRLHGCQHAFQFYLLELSGRYLRLAFLIFQRLGTENEKARLHRLAFRVPATGVMSNQFLEDLERIWALRDVIPARM